MALTQLVQPPPLNKIASRDPSTSLSDAATPHILTTEALRLIELSDRVSAVMKSSVSGSLLRTDAVLSIFRILAS